MTSRGASAAASANHTVFVAPASFAQERLWFLEQLHPGSAAYVMPFPLRVRAALRRDALDAALTDLVDRHEVLRTTFLAIDGRPQQVIGAEPRFRLGYTDLRDLPAPERARRSAALAAADAARPFDLSAGPLFRAHLVQHAADDYTLLLAVHHIIADGWSIDLLTRDIRELYTARQEKRRPNLPALPIQYADFAQWQRDTIGDETFAESLRYWVRELSGLDDSLQLPTDRPRPPVQSLRGAVHAFVLDGELLTACQRRADEANATLFALLLAAFEIFLHRYSGQTDFSVGTPVANRGHAEVEQLVGLFINTLAVPCRIDPEASFFQHLQRVRSQVVEALEHQHVPFEQVVDALVPGRDLSTAPLFQTLFVLQSSATPGPREVLEPDPDVLRSALGNGTAKFDLTFTIVEANRKLFCTFEYCTDLFDAGTIARMSRHLEVLLRAAVSNPATPVGRLGLISPEERRTALIDWNRTDAPLPDQLTLHRAIETRSEAWLDRVAIRHAGTSVTYGELLAAADAIAARLQALGVRPGDRVAVCLSRTPHLIAALLGVLKCGAAYVPLDRGYPHMRVRFVLRDSGATALVTERSFQWLFENIGLPCLVADEGQAGHAPHPRVSAETASDAAAYVIYTSGSSGTPKGVVIAHRSAVAFLAWARQAYRDEEWCGVLTSTSICFDLSVFEIFATLFAGGTIVLVRDALDQGDARGPVTMINTVPSAIKEMLDLDLVPATVRTINLAGEPLSNALVQALYARTPVERVVNLYGPTEDTTYATMAEIPRGYRGVVPIGRPIANRRAYVLDAACEPVPPGVVGELFLGGAGVALGYHGLPDLTRERFVADPFVPGARLFRTGDLARYRPDGDIEFLGRRDGQVKLRGYRIEVGEVREVLNAQAGVADSLVLVRNEPGGPVLAAYLTAGDGAELKPEALAGGLARHLPSYMIPSRWTVLERFPLTPSGKIDVKQLPAPQAPAPARSDKLERPRTSAEEAVAEIWRAVLGRDDIGIGEDFFELGGHSLLLAQVAARVHEKTGVAIPLREYFEHPTVEQLAARLNVLTALDRGGQARITPRPLDTDVRLSFAQERLWFLDQFTEQRELYTIPTVYRIDGALDLDTFDRALQAVVARHETLRTHFETRDGIPVQIIETDREIEIDLYTLDALDPQQRRQRIEALTRRNLLMPFDLARGPLLRCLLVRESARRFVAMLAVHHSVADGWSLRILQRDLGEFYRAFATGDEPQLPPLPIQYADVAAWQRTVLDGPRMSHLLAYWRDHLADAPAVTTFPEDRPRPPVQTYRGAAVYFEIDSGLKGSLEALARSESATLFVTLLTVFHLVLGRYAGSRDVVTGTPVAGRHYPELEHLIGFFVNTVPVRTRLAATSTVRAAIAATREAVLGGFDHQDAPFERIVDALTTDRQLQYSPVFQIMFGFQNLLGEDAAADSGPPPDLSGSTTVPVVTTSKFDMTVALTELPHGIVGAIEYNTDLYDGSTIERIIANYLAALDEVVSRPESRVGDLQLLSNAEARSIAAFTDDESANCGVDHGYTLVEQHARRSPDADAIVDGAVRVTYGQLRDRADSLALQLRDRGIAEGSLVELAWRPGVDAIATALALWKVGAAVVPVTSDRADGADLSVRCVATRGDGEDVACVVESQHDGERVGVAFDRRGVSAAAGAFHRLLRDDSGDAACQLRVGMTATRFAAAPIEALAVLMHGDALHVLHAEADASIDVLAADILDIQHEPFRQSLGAAARRVRVVVRGTGDCLPDAVNDMASDDRFDVVIVTGCAECQALAAGSARDYLADGVLGRPLPGVRAVVLDDHRMTLPIGAAGEIWVAGDALARGYLDRSDLTERRFVERQVHNGVTERLFRTGWTGRWLSDGRLARIPDRDPTPGNVSPDAVAERDMRGNEPTTEMERVLAAIWAEVLGREQVGIHDSFFALGGHSLLAIQAIVRIKTAGFDITPREIFERPTVSELAAALSGRGRASSAGASAVSSAPLTKPALDIDAIDVDALSDADVDRLLRQLADDAEPDRTSR